MSFDIKYTYSFIRFGLQHGKPKQTVHDSKVNVMLSMTVTRPSAF